MSAATGLKSRAAEAGAIERRLRNVVASVDNEWKDQARRDFDDRYLKEILDSARQLQKELNELASELARAGKMAGL
jgi:uncharacterized protein YukE